MAIHPLSALRHRQRRRGWQLTFAAGLAALTAACATSPRPIPVAVPVAVPVHVPMPPRPAPPPPADWRDAPQSSGDWTWSLAGGRSTAQFGAPGLDPLFALICDKPARRVLLERSGTAPSAVPITLRSTFSTRALMSDPAIPAPGMIAVALPVYDSALDGIAFSRGRFTVEVADMAALYLPSWPEVSRVIEDCRS
jgi:hypothetical protein